VTGAFPLRTTASQFAAVFIPYITLQFLAFTLLARGNGSLILADRFAMAKFFTHIRSVSGYLTKRRLRFRVTPKGAPAGVPAATFAPQLVLIVATLGALAFAVYERQWGYADEVPGWGSAAVWVNAVFAIWNAWVAASIVRHAFAGRQQRAGFRFAESLPVSVRVMRRDGRLAAIDVAVTGDLSPAGTALRTMHPIPEDARVELTLPLARASVPVTGRLVNRRAQETPYGTVHIQGIEFEDLTVEARDAIELHCAQHATPLERQRYDQAPARWRLRNIRGETRVSVGMPAEVFVGPREGRLIGLALLEDVSPVGARIVIDHPVQPDSIVRLAIPGTTLDVTGKVVFVHALETSLGMRFVVGMNSTAESAAGSVRDRLAWFTGILELAVRYGAAARGFAARSGSAAFSSGRKAMAAFPRVSLARWSMPQMSAARLSMPRFRQRPAIASTDSTTEVPEAVVAPVAIDPVVESPPPADAPAFATAPAQDEPEQSVPHDAPTDSPESALMVHTQTGDEDMPSARPSSIPARPIADSTAPVLFTVRGNSARIDGAFGDAESIEVHGDVAGDLRVAGSLLIHEQASVNGNVTAASVRVEGEFTGDLRATEAIEIAETGTVNGTLKCDELVIERGGVFNGTATRTARQEQQQTAARSRDRDRDRDRAAASSRQEAPRDTTPRAPLADIAAPPATSVLDFAGDDDNFDSLSNQQIPLA
jgi:cytoskeletal protein CcmA (bactofilin family)